MHISNIARVFFGLSAYLVVVSSAFTPTTSTFSSSSSSSTLKTSSTQLAAKDSPSNDNDNSRRFFLKEASFMAGALLLSPLSAQAGLLDDFGTDPSKIQPVKKEETKVASSGPKSDVQIDPTLKGSYYYPTAKKRYLPRIQKVTAKISEVPQAIASGDWEAVQTFSTTAENAVLPLQLYVSSLDGQGLSMSNSYAKVMKKDAATYEQNYKLLQKAIKNKDKDLASLAVTEMGVAVADYRQAGRLSDDDGNIPSVSEIKLMTMRRPTVQMANTY